MTFVAFWSTYIEISGVQQGQSKTRTFTRNPLPVKPELLPIPTTVVLYKGKAGIRAMKVSAHWLPTSTTSPSETGREHAAIDTSNKIPTAGDDAGYLYNLGGRALHRRAQICERLHASRTKVNRRQTNDADYVRGRCSTSAAGCSAIQGSVSN